jgi:hypothetical protein
MTVKIRNAVLLLLGLALALRLAWVLVQPLMPVLLVLTCLIGIYWLVFRRSS